MMTSHGNWIQSVVPGTGVHCGGLSYVIVCVHLTKRLPPFSTTTFWPVHVRTLDWCSRFTFHGRTDRHSGHWTGNGFPQGAMSIDDQMYKDVFGLPTFSRERWAMLVCLAMIPDCCRISGTRESKGRPSIRWRCAKWSKKKVVKFGKSFAVPKATRWRAMILWNTINHNSMN